MMKRTASWAAPLAALVSLFLAGGAVNARPVQAPPARGLQDRLDALVHDFNGRVGISVRDTRTGLGGGIAADDPFPMQSVAKLAVAIALLDQVDNHRLTLSEPVTLHPEDLSLYWQPVAAAVQAAGPAGYRTDWADLLRRMVVESDNAAADLIIARLGGPAAVQAALEAKGLGGLHIDRDEKHLQTSIACLEWQPAFSDPATLEAAVAAVPLGRRLSCRSTYLNDIRDTVRPAAMTVLLSRLVAGDLLSKPGTRRLLDLMSASTTGPDRLAAGLAPRWRLAHKTGTGPTIEGMALSTNDVGVLTAPDGHTVVVAVFIASTTATRAQAEALIANVARSITGQPTR